MVKTTCQTCGSQFNLKPNRLKRYKHVFCSQQCYGLWRSKHIRGNSHPNWKDKIVRVCEWCGKEYIIKAYRDANSRFCSKVCRSKYVGRKAKEGNWRGHKDKIKRLCKNCGKTFDIYPSRFARGRGKFCSKECMREYYGFGKHEDYYGPNWKRQRQKALARDHFTCQICTHSDRELDVHHKIPFKDCKDYVEANKLVNLITLCKQCHGKVSMEVIDCPILKQF